MAYKGGLRVQCFNGATPIPVDKCKVSITPTTEDGVEKGKSIELYSNQEGITETVDLDAPPLENSESPGLVPYSFCNINVERPGFVPLVIEGVQIYPDRIALQKCNLKFERDSLEREEKIIIIEPNTLVGDFPPKIPEDPNKPVPKPQGTVVLPQPVVPEFIRVHDGGPSNDKAPNYTINYADYIKNVACCEIYSTWPETTIRANIYCIISFTLNRIYTEWYRGKGKNFDITSSTAYDHAFNYGRNIYDNISRIVDEIFATYIKRIDMKQPLLAQYCDGVKVKCPGWLTQWGSKYLGDEGKTPYEILTHFYGNDIELKRADKVKGIPKSYPGETLKVGSRGEPVRVIQEYLNRIGKAYPLIKPVAVDGIYGEQTKESVKTFQSIFNLPQTGEVDYATWYRISDIYVGVTRIAELRGSIYERERIFYPPVMLDSIGKIPFTSFYE